MPGIPICVIRKYQDKDEGAVKEIMTNAVMEKVNTYYFGMLFSYGPLQIGVVLMAVLFIIFGVPFKVAFIAFPLTILLLYGLVWLGHFVKTSDLQNDLSSIPVNYLENNNTYFYVAEVYIKKGSMEEFSQYVNKVKKVEFDFLTENEFAVRSINLDGLRTVIAGCVGISQSWNDSKRARIKRFSVANMFRRRHLATHLLQAAVQFCRKAKYEGIEAITTEYQSEADILYANENFRRIPHSCKSYLFLDEVYIYMMYKDLSLSKENESKSGRSTPEIAGP